MSISVRLSCLCIWFGLAPIDSFASGQKEEARSCHMVWLQLLEAVFARFASRPQAMTTEKSHNGRFCKSKLSSQMGRVGLCNRLASERTVAESSSCLIGTTLLRPHNVAARV